MIRSFKCKHTQSLWEEEQSRKFNTIGRVALRKLYILHRAIDLNDLRTPPGNRLEALSGNRNGQYSIRINDQYRICFIWRSEGAYEVEIVDYH